LARSCRLDEYNDNNNNNADGEHDHGLWQTETIENSKFIRWKKLISVAFLFSAHFLFFFFMSGSNINKGYMGN